ncbi:MAG: S41 family peptidase [Eubacterium sp.]|nr:S41 family peptidase [Eubacterium sp.]
MNENEITEVKVEEKEETKKKKKPGRIKKLILTLLVLAVGFSGGLLFAYSGVLSGGSLNYVSVIKKLNMLQEYIDAYYLDDYEQENLESGLLNGFMSGLGDPYSCYYTKEDYQSLTEEDSGEYKGIGITVMQDSLTGEVVIEQVMKDQPAYKAGIESGDVITAVDNEKVEGLRLNEVVHRIKHSKDEKVKISISREEKELEFLVDKANIVIQSVESEMKEGTIGYISVSQFIENTDEQFIEAVDKLEKEGMTGLVLDLRDNGGGLVDSCVNMVSRIIPEGDLIVYTEDKNGGKIEYNSNSDKVLDVPIVILVNEDTASASEIMTGCLKDYGLAEVLGTQTFGKGIVQSIVPFVDGSAMKLTVAKYYTPKGNDIHKVGIEPDIKMEISETEWKAAQKNPEKDTQLKKAIRLLQQKNK